MEGVVGLPESGEVELEERKALVSDNVPEAYLDAWARLQLQRPHGVTEAHWRQAVNDAGLFLDRWGARASELLWAPGDLFDAPHDGRDGGLAWFIKGRPVAAMGPTMAQLIDGTIWLRGLR